MSIPPAGPAPQEPTPGADGDAPGYSPVDPATRPQYGAGTPVREGATSRASVLAQIQAQATPGAGSGIEPAASSDQIGELEPVSAQLFTNGGPHYTDVDQGRLNDCWLMASLAALAYKDPEVLEEMIDPVGDGTFNVTFQQSSIDPDTAETVYRPVTINVKPDFYVDAGDGKTPLYADPAGGGKTPALWTSLIEKAYAQWKGGYDGLQGGVAADAMEAITGEDANTIAFDGSTDLDQLYTTIRGAIWNGSPVVAATADTTDGSVVQEHGYMVIDAWDQDGKKYVGLYNPYGQDGQAKGIPQYVTLPLDQFRKNMNGVTIGEP
jgi:hypothetical protein